MSLEALQSATVVINSPLLEVFDFVANPTHLVEWVPFYSEIIPSFKTRLPKKDDWFVAVLSMLFPQMDWIPGWKRLFSGLTKPKIKVYVDDIVHGRRIAYRSNDVGWTTICDFEAAGGRTILTMTNSLWSLQGLSMSYWLGPAQAFANDQLTRILAGLKRRLEARAANPDPRIFFSYRRNNSRYVGGRIFDALSSEFGLGTVFRDTDSLLAGGNWAGEITKAIQGCDVVVVHIGHGWEDLIVSKLGTTDGLRDELLDALPGRNQKPPEEVRFIPVFTSKAGSVSPGRRMQQIEEAFAAALKRSPEWDDHLRPIADKFKTSLQGLRLREDPDFRGDLEHLMRAVWNQFRQPKNGTSSSSQKA